MVARLEKVNEKMCLGNWAPLRGRCGAESSLVVWTGRVGAFVILDRRSSLAKRARARPCVLQAMALGP